MDYAFTHEGRNYTPNQTADVTDAAEHNRQQELAEIAWLKTAPERVILYVKMPNTAFPSHETGFATVQTWLGTRVSDPGVYIGRPVPIGGIAGQRASRRAVDCRIFGVRYVGWYYESSGDYCRLKKAKRQ